MSKITESAKGQMCQIWLHPYCLGTDTSTTVFCHAPSPEKGTARKSPDWWGAYGCAACHDIVDGRHQNHGIRREDIDKCFHNGIFRTQKMLIESGLIKIGQR